MSKKKGRSKPKTWIEIIQSDRREFPQGYCVTRIHEDKRYKKPKHKLKEMEE